MDLPSLQEDGAPSTVEEWSRWIPAPGLLETIGAGRLIDVDARAGVVRAGFTALPQFCHTRGTVVQGGFITAWLDFAMAFATVVRTGGKSNVASLDIHVSFLERVGPGPVVAEGRVRRLGRKVAFLESSLFDTDGRLLATAVSSGMIVPYTGSGAAPSAG